jgi:hypothetical protein
MTWFTDTTNAPRILTEGYRIRQPLPWFVSDSTSPRGYHRDIAETHYEFRGLTQAAADSIAAQRKSLTTGYAYQVDARWFRLNDAGGYGVQVVEKTTGAWVADT